MLKGIDVSHHQESIDWAKVTADFALIRAGYGKFDFQEDPYLSCNIKGASEKDIPIGVYWYSYADNIADAKKEAEACLKVISQYRDKITLPVFFDQEYEPDILGISKSTRTRCCTEFLKVIEEAGYKIGMYGSKDWLENKINVGQLDEDTTYWVAQYDVDECTYVGIWSVWQYTSKGRVDGISGNVDLNQAKDDFVGLINDGWQKVGDKWYWYENGKKVTNCWRKVTGASGVAYWYYLGPNGAMLKGMQRIKGKIYYLNPAAAMGVPEGACIITDSNGEVKRS